MRATTVHSPTIQFQLPSRWSISIVAVRESRHRSYRTASKSSGELHHYHKNAAKYWDAFYRRHQQKFFKDRHYLEKDWGSFFEQDDDDESHNGKVVLEVGCGSGSALFPLMATFPNVYVHACDLSPSAISLVKTNEKFEEDRVNAFVSDVTREALCDEINPSSVDVVTMVFMLSAVSPSKMPLILQNIKTVIKPNGYVLFRDYAVGDFAQVKLQNKERLIGEDVYVRGDGTCSFYFSEDFLSSLFLRAGFKTSDMTTYCRQIHNRSRGITMDRLVMQACDTEVSSMRSLDDSHTICLAGPGQYDNVTVGPAPPIYPITYLR